MSELRNIFYMLYLEFEMSELRNIFYMLYLEFQSVIGS